MKIILDVDDKAAEAGVICQIDGHGHGLTLLCLDAVDLQAEFLVGHGLLHVDLLANCYLTVDDLRIVAYLLPACNIGLGEGNRIMTVRDVLLDLEGHGQELTVEGEVALLGHIQPVCLTCIVLGSVLRCCGCCRCCCGSCGCIAAVIAGCCLGRVAGCSSLTLLRSSSGCILCLQRTGCNDSHLCHSLTGGIGHILTACVGDLDNLCHFLKACG